MAFGNDLGTAHGKIKVDADTKGIGKAEKDLKLFDRALELVGRAAKQFESGLNKMERELQTASREMHAADRAASGLSDGIHDADRATLDWSHDLKGLQDRLKGVNQTAKDLGPPLLQVAKVGMEFRKTEGGITGFVKAFTAAGAASTIISTLTGKFLGMGAAMAAMPAWGQKIIKFSNSFRLLTFGVGILTAAAVKTGIFGRVYEAAFRKIVKHSTLGTKAIMGMEKALKPFGPAFSRAVRYVSDLNQAVDKIPKGAVQALVGFAMMQNGVRGLIARFAVLARMSPKVMAIVGTAFAALPAVVEAGAATLRVFSNLLLQVKDAAFQLAGGLLAIPGGITMMVTAMTTLKVLFGGLKTAFEDLFKAKTAEEFAAAIEALPEHLKPLGKIFAEIIPKWKELSTDMQKTFVIGAAEQLKALSDTYLPAVKSGVLPLVNSFRQVKDELVKFAAQGASISFMKQAFQNTSQVVSNLKPAIVGLLTGFRDIASVGMTFIRDMSAGAGGLTEKFAEWARVNKENGNLMKWMKDAVSGAKDLLSAMKDLGKAVWTLLTLFATDTGDNALERFAKSMKKFNDAVQKSAAGGVLKQIGDAVKQMGTDKLEQLWDVFKSLGDAIKDVIPFVMQMSEAFSAVFYPALKATIEIIQQVVKVLNEFGGAKVIGTVLGLVAAFKTLQIVMGPMRNVVQIMIGAFNGFKGAETLVLGLAGTFEKFGPAGKKASDAIMGIGDTIKTAFGAAGIAAAIGLAFYEFYQAGAEQIDNMKAKVTELDTFTAGMGKQIASQIIDEGTLKNSVSIFNDQIDQLRTKLQEAADSKPGFAGQIVDIMRQDAEDGVAMADQGIPLPGVEPQPIHTEEFDKLNDAATAAQKADEAIDKLGISTEELTNKVTGSKEGFDAFIQTLLASGDGGEQAAAHFRTLREEWESLQQAGEGGVRIASGIDEIAKSAGDASGKLDGLRKALEGAGLMQTSALDAAFAYAESIREIGDAANEVVDRSQPVNDILNAQGDNYNFASQNAQNLRTALLGLAQDFQAAAAASGDTAGEWAKMQPALESLAKQFNLPIEKIRELIGLEGALPDQIALLLTVEGADELQQDVVGAIIKAQGTAKGQPVVIPIEADPEQVKHALEGLLGPGSVLSTTDSTITLNPNIDKAKLDAAVKTLTDAGITVGNAKPTNPATVPIAPTVKPGNLGGTGKPDEPVVAPAPAPAAPAPPKAPEVNVDDVKTKVEEVKAKLAEIENLPPVKIDFELASLDPLMEKVNTFWNKLLEIQDRPAIKIDIEIAQLEQIDQAKTKLDEFLAKTTQVTAQATAAWAGYKSAVTGAFNEIVAAFSSMMDQMAQKIAAAGANNLAAGEKFGKDFAQGITNSVDDIAAAADAAAKAAADRMPHSPAKKGPLSGRGWSGYAGQAFANDFAQGITDATGAVADSSDAMAERATKSMAGRDESFNNFMSGILRVLDIASTAIGIVQSTFDHISEGFKIITDLMKPKETAKPEEAAAEGDKSKTPAGTSDTDKAILSQVKSGRYSQTGNADLTKGLGDCSSAVEDLVNIIDKKPTGGRAMSTANAAEWLTGRGFKKGAGGPGDMRVAFNVQHMQATLPGGTNFNWGSDAAAAAGGLAPNKGAADPALTEKYYRTATNGEQASQYADEVSSRDLTVFDPQAQASDALNTKELTQSDQDIIKTLRTGDKQLDEAITAGEDPKKTNEEQLQALNSIDKSIADLSQSNTADSQKQVGALQNLKGTVAQGQAPSMEPGKDPVTQAQDMMGGIMDIASGAMSIAQDVIGVIKTTIETIGMVKASADLLVRGVENTEDLNTFIDTIQKFIELAAKVAQTVSDVTGMIAGIMGKAGGADFGASAALQAVSAIAGLISGILTTVNAAIDMAQEAWHIFGSYFGQFLGFLAGAGDQLEGDVKFLLDQNDKTLKAYSKNAPQDKASHPYGQEVGGFLNNDKTTREPLIGAITVFGGPDQDPRETTRNMMFAVKTSAMGATYAQ